MSIVIPHLADTFLRRNMVKPMCLLLSNFLFYHLPSTSYFMCFSGRMPTAASKAIMFHSYSILCLFERKSNPFSSKYISIEIFTKDLCCLVINFILRIDHYDILGSDLIKDLTYDLRMARIDENELQLRHGLFFRQ